MANEQLYMTLEKMASAEFEERNSLFIGHAAPIKNEQEAMAFIRKLCAKFTDDQEYVEREIAQALDHTLIFTLEVEHMTGKLVNEA